MLFAERYWNVSAQIVVLQFTTVLFVRSVANHMSPKSKGERVRWKIHRFDRTESTNLLAIRGNPGDVFVAAEQTAGRGRLDHKWHSCRGQNLLMSAVLDVSDIAPTEVATFPLLAGVAIIKTIKRLSQFRPDSLTLHLKWPNDVYLNSRKVCGILVQSKAESGRLAHAVVGIGVNLLPPVGGFPEGISDVAGSVFTSPLPEMRSRLTAAIIDNVASLCRLPMKSEVIEEYRSRSWLDGCDVNVIRGESSVPAKVVGIDGECRLEVLYECGGRDFLSAGEVSVRKAKK